MSVLPPGVLFVCLGNICRSPTAECVARAVFRERGLDISVASRGIGDWHVGQGADPRAVRVARAEGFDLGAHRARQFQDDDFNRFATVLAVDMVTLAELRRRAPQGVRAPERLLVAAGMASPRSLEYGDVPDPYAGTLEDFRAVLELIRRGVDGLADRLGAAGPQARAVRQP
jgi:protein-tyrosine phosphatase